MKRVIALLMENQPGALSRVVGLFSQRGYNIETLVVAPTTDPTLSRLTMSTKGDEKVVEQITKQLNKLIDVVMVSDLSDSQHIEKELMLVKFTEDYFPKETFEESSIVSNSDGVINVQVVGTSLELDELITTLDSSKPIEIVRSGVLGISSNKDILSIEN